MKSVRRFLIVLSLFFIIVLSGCISEHESERASHILSIAEVTIKQYVESNYPGYEIKNIRIIHSSLGIFNTYVTDFVKARIGNASETFDIVNDTKSGKLYTNRNVNEFIKNAIRFDSELFNFVRYIGIIPAELLDINNDNQVEPDMLINYFDINDRIIHHYRLYFLFEISVKSSLDSIYSLVSGLTAQKLDYEIKILIGESQVDISNLSDRAIVNRIRSLVIEHYIGTVINISYNNGKPYEYISDMARLDFEDGFIVYDSVRYFMDVFVSDISLGSVKYSKISKNYKLVISRFDTAQSVSYIGLYADDIYDRYILEYADSLQEIQGSLYRKRFKDKVYFGRVVEIRIGHYLESIIFVFYKESVKKK